MKNKAFVVLGSYLTTQCFWASEEFFFADVFNAKNFMEDWIEANISKGDWDKCDFCILEIKSIIDVTSSITLSFETVKTTFTEK
jgi:hypothetical protein